MSSPATGLERLSISDAMPLRTRTMDAPRQAQGPSGRTYDLSSLSAAQAGSASDGLRAETVRLLPVLTKATFPESGFVGFEVTESHSVRIPLPEEGGEEASEVQCSCTTFERQGFCGHIVWLYDGLQASLHATPISPRRSTIEKLSESDFLQRLNSMADEIASQAHGLAEKINRLQPHQPSSEDIDQAILDAFAVFDGNIDDSPRKRRRGDEILEEGRPHGPKLRTCLEISPEEFFSDTQPPKNDFRDVVVPGNLPATLKGLVRYGTLFRESLLKVIDPHFRAHDFLNRLDTRLSDWKERWENFRKDRRTTVPLTFVKDYASTIREVLRQMKMYEDERDCPDSFYDHAIDLGITLLEEACGSNADLYEGHSRQNSQARHTVPQHLRDKNLFINLIIDTPSEQTGFVRSLVEMLFQFGPEQFDESHVSKLQVLYADLNDTEKVQSHHISPLQNFLQQYESWARKEAIQRKAQSTTPSEAGTSQAATSMTGAEGQTRRYRELRAAPPST